MVQFYAIMGIGIMQLVQEIVIVVKLWMRKKNKSLPELVEILCNSNIMWTILKHFIEYYWDSCISCFVCYVICWKMISSVWKNCLILSYISYHYIIFWYFRLFLNCLLKHVVYWKGIVLRKKRLELMNVLIMTINY